MRRFHAYRMPARAFEGKYILCLFSILIFSIVDGGMTLTLVERGAWEANPLMRYALSLGEGVFMLVKYFLTAGGLLVLFSFSRRRLFNGRFTVDEIAFGFFMLYAVLIIYELTVFHII